MKRTRYILFLTLIILLIVDITIRIYYCSGIFLLFDSTEFNNIATPIISLLGFIGVIAAIIISFKQLKLSTSEKYLIHFNEYIKSNFDEIKKREVDNLPYEKGELVQFFSYVLLEYEKLLVSCHRYNDVYH